MKLMVVGAGGHASVVVDAARATGVSDIVVVDANTTKLAVGSAPVVGTFDDAPGVTHFIVAVGDNHARAAEYARCVGAGLEPHSVIHPSAVISPEALIAAGVYIGALAVVNPGAVVRTNSIINTAAIIEHDCSIGKHAFVGPGAAICGGCSIGEYTLVGANASMIPLTSVGDDTTVGAGAAVTRNFGDGVTVVGVPAHEISGR